MAYTLTYTKTARKSLQKLPAKVRTQIKTKLGELCVNPRSEMLDTKPMKGENYFRLRVGRYRVLYELQHEVLVVMVLDVGPRQSIYEH